MILVGLVKQRRRVRYLRDRAKVAYALCHHPNATTVEIAQRSGLTEQRTTTVLTVMRVYREVLADRTTGLGYRLADLEGPR